MSNIIELSQITTADLHPDRVLHSAMGKMNNVMVIGEDTDGEFYLAANKSDLSLAIYYLEVAKKKLLEM